MNPELEELGRRAVACKHWHWMPGMLYNHPKDRRDSALRPRGPNAPIIMCGPGGGLPIFSDPATLGCLLALVREAWSDQSIGIFRSALYPEWCVLIQKGGLQGFHAPTDAGALVAALEAAP